VGKFGWSEDVSWEKSVVRILEPNGNRTAGTGFLVSSSGMIVTCSHVLKSYGQQQTDKTKPDTARLAFCVEPERLYNAQIIFWLPWGEGDLAVLQVTTSEGDEIHLPDDAEACQLGKALAVTGHDYLTLGYPDADMTLFPTGGHIDGIVRDAPSASASLIIQLSVSNGVTEGFSGAPVYDTALKRVIGILSFIRVPDANGLRRDMAYAVPIDLLLASFQDIKANDICPYRGMRAFTEEDAPIFFGRKNHVEELLNRLRTQPRILAVVGASGSGKSSLVRAGLIPRLCQGALNDSQSWKIVPITPNSELSEQLAKHLPIHDDLGEAVRLFRQQYPVKTRVVLFIDQFEQFFGEVDRSTSENFLGKLKALLDDREQPISLILTMRSDFLGRLSSLPIMNWVQQGLFTLQSTVDENDLDAMIVKPAESVGIDFEDGLVKSLIRDAKEIAESSTGEQNVRAVLPLLSSTLEQLWQKWYDRRDDLTLSHDAYHEIGGITGSLKYQADKAYSKFQNNKLFERIFLDLVQVSVIKNDDKETPIFLRRQRTLEELCRGEDEKEKTRVHSIVTELADYRLLVTDGSTEKNNPSTKVDIIHEILLTEWDILQGWLQHSLKVLKRRVQLESQFSSWRDDKGELLYGRDLRDARECLEKFELLSPAQSNMFLKAFKYVQIRMKQSAQVATISDFVLLSEYREALFQFRWLIFLALTVGVFAIIAGRALMMVGAKVDARESVVEFEAAAILGGQDTPLYVPSFSLERYEVSYRRYDRCVVFGGCDEPVGGSSEYAVMLEQHPDFPITDISAVEASNFCRWIDRRLPTAVEWERAARGTAAENRAWPWGDERPNNEDDPEAPRANLRVDGAFDDWQRELVAVNAPEYQGGVTNEGIWHLLGNVSEWTASPATCGITCEATEIWGGESYLNDALAVRGRGYLSGDLGITEMKNIWVNSTLDVVVEESSSDIGFRCAAD
jgi:hypothetical protein